MIKAKYEYVIEKKENNEWCSKQTFSKLSYVIEYVNRSMKISCTYATVHYNLKHKGEYHLLKNLRIIKREKI